VNLMNQHLTYFTLAGARKYDYPPSFDYHEPWWGDYKYLNDHYARLSLALSSGKQINDILVLEPTTSAWLYDSYSKPNKMTSEIGQAFQSFVTQLEKSQVEYDLGSENIIKDLGSVSKGKLIIGVAGYSKVVIPLMTENLDLATFKLLEKFVSNGGTLIAFSKPELVNGSQSEELKEFFSKNSDKIIFPDQINQKVISETFINQNLIFKNVNGGTLYHHRRVLDDGQLIFLVNSDLKSELTGSLQTNGRDAAEMNTLTGEIYGYPNSEDNGRINLTFSIPPAGSLLLFIPAAKPLNYTVPQMAKELNPVQSSADKIIVTRNEDNALMIDFCDIEIGNEVIKDLHTFYAADRVFKYYGFKNGNPWNTSVQFRRNIVERDTFSVNTGFTATYHFNIKGKFDLTNMKAVVERPELWKVYINGTEVEPQPGKWWLDRSFKTFSIGSLVRNGENTITLKASPMKISAEIEPVYITGDFSVKPADKGWTIEAPVSLNNGESWKNQGLPFYSWGVTYSKEYTIENNAGNWKISLGKWNGTMAEVSVNGIKSEIIAFPPYSADITQLIKPGVNKIEIKVIGSLKNLLGPHHNNPRPGLVSPWSFRNVKKYPSGSEYQMIEYGLFEDFTLRHGI